MIRVGCTKAVVAPLLSDKSEFETEERTPEIVYGSIVSLPNVQQVDLTMSVQSTNVDSDDTTDVVDVCTGCSGTLTRNSLSPDEASLLLGETKVNGINVSKGRDEAPYCAFGFQSLLKGEGANGRYLCHWILKTKFALSNMTSQSMGNESLTPQADSLTFKSTSRECDGAWRLYIRTNDEEEIKKFFSQETLQTLTNAVTQTFAKPINSVEFVDALPASGNVGVIYINDNKGYYWNGSGFVEC